MPFFVMDDATGSRIALIAAGLAVPFGAIGAALWLGRGYQSLAAVSVLCIGLGIVSGAFA